MKRYNLIVLLLLFTSALFAQAPFKYVIVPTQFPEIGKGFNPYEISSSIQKILNEKNIECFFKSEERPFDFCDALTVNVTNVSTMFKNKLKIELVDCTNQVMWKGEGVGMSKEYNIGYAEAFSDAVKDLNELPVNNHPVDYSQFKRLSDLTPAPEAEPATQAVRTPAADVVAEPIVEATPEAKPETSPEVRVTNEPTEKPDLYHPGNLFYNYRYFIDVVEKDGDNKALLIINGELLGYQNLETIAQLTPSGLENVYTVSWKNPDGNQLNGLANLDDHNLKLSLKNGDNQTVISLTKY